MDLLDGCMAWLQVSRWKPVIQQSLSGAPSRLSALSWATYAQWHQGNAG